MEETKRNKTLAERFYGWGIITLFAIMIFLMISFMSNADERFITIAENYSGAASILGSNGEWTIANNYRGFGENFTINSTLENITNITLHLNGYQNDVDAVIELKLSDNTTDEHFGTIICISQPKQIDEISDCDLGLRDINFSFIGCNVSAYQNMNIWAIARQDLVPETNNICLGGNPVQGDTFPDGILYFNQNNMPNKDLRLFVYGDATPLIAPAIVFDVNITSPANNSIFANNTELFITFQTNQNANCSAFFDNISVFNISNTLNSSFFVNLTETGNHDARVDCISNVDNSNATETISLLVISFFIPDIVGNYTWSVEQSKNSFNSCSDSSADMLLRVILLAIGFAMAVLGFTKKEVRVLAFLGALIIIISGMLFTPCQAMIGILIILCGIAIGFTAILVNK